MKPIIKWAGGKLQLVKTLANKIPKNILVNLQDKSKYIEPFLGGGALLFALSPKNAIVNDINKPLMNMYSSIRNHFQEVSTLVNNYDVSINSQKYYSLRNLFNIKLSHNEYDTELAALFIFLNKHSFNGLFRVNAQGEFNVPYNSSTRPSMNVTNGQNISNYLQNVTLMCDDFMNVTQLAKPNDFIFIDSPYPPLHDKTFSEYNVIKFSDDDHKRLAMEVQRLHQLHAHVMVTNHDIPLIRSLYSNFNIEKVPVRRSVNSDGSNRTSEEIIITNF